jgi:hypothetical protein
MSSSLSSSSVIVAQSRYGEAVVNVDETTRTFSINNSHCRGSFTIPRIMRMNDVWRCLPTDMIDMIMEFVGATDGDLNLIIVSDIFINEVCRGNIEWPIYVKFNGLIHPERSDLEHKWLQNYPDVMSDAIALVKIDDDGDVEIQSAQTLSFWLRFHTTLVPRILMKKHQRFARMVENVHRSNKSC